MDYPNIKKGVFYCLLVGGVVGGLCLGFCYWVSTFPDVTPGSLAKAVRPWWSNWNLALCLALFFGLPIGILAAFRPEMEDNENK